MTKSAFIIFLIFAQTLSAQNGNDTTSKKVKKVNPSTLDIYYGNSIFFNNFYNQLNYTDKVNFNLPIRQFGIGLSNFGWWSFGRNPGTFQTSFTYLLNSKLTFQDTIQSKISGFSYSFSMGKDVIKKSKYFKLNTYIGFNTGRTVLTELDDINLNNPFFAPKILLQPKVIIRRLCFSLLVDCSYDISNKNWKKTNNSKTKYQLDKFDQSKLTLLFSIGYRPFGHE